MIVLAVQLPRLHAFKSSSRLAVQRKLACRSLSMASDTTSGTTSSANNRGKLLILGGTGYLGQNVCKAASMEGYSVVSLSRRGLPPLVSMTDEDKTILSPTSGKVDYRQGDARQKSPVTNILQEGGFTGIVHCIGLLFDDASGLGSYNKFVSGSGSLPDPDSTYDTITRLTAFNAIDAAMEYAERPENRSLKPFPFCFTSAAEAGWPEMTGGPFIESIMPEFIGRYMVAKRVVESKLMDESQPVLRPIIVRPSLIYSMDRIASLPSVGAFTIANKIGVPFVDRPVTVKSLAKTIVRSMSDASVKGVQRYSQIDKLGS
jgi:nucleoside-diphosphate-sugar epimerase